MSHELTLHLFAGVSQTDIYTIIRQKIDRQKERFPEYIQKAAEEQIFIQNMEGLFPALPKADDMDGCREFFRTIDRACENSKRIYGTMAFLYWPKLQLLGIQGPCEHGVPIVFQNKSDQDVPFSVWELLDCFAPIVHRYQKMSKQEIEKRYADRYGEPCDKIEYMRRVFCYEEIYELLDIGLYIYSSNEFIKEHPFLRVNTIETFQDHARWERLFKQTIIDYFKNKSSNKQ